MKNVSWGVLAIFLGLICTADGKDPVEIFGVVNGASKTFYLSEVTRDEVGQIISQAQAYYTSFHKKWHNTTYKDVPVQEREFPNPEEDIAARFARNLPFILNGAFKLFVVKDENGVLASYAILHVIGDTIYSIETVLYISGVNEQFHKFLQDEFKDARRFVFFVWKKTLPFYPNMKANSKGEECSDLHVSIANPAGFYQDERLQPRSEWYQGFERLYGNYEGSKILRSSTK